MKSLKAKNIQVELNLKIIFFLKKMVNIKTEFKGHEFLGGSRLHDALTSWVSPYKELGLCLVLGLLAGFVSIFLILTLYCTKDLFLEIPSHLIFKPALGW